MTNKQETINFVIDDALSEIKQYCLDNPEFAERLFGTLNAANQLLQRMKQSIQNLTFEPDFNALMAAGRIFDGWPDEEPVVEKTILAAYEYYRFQKKCLKKKRL